MVDFQLLSLPTLCYFLYTESHFGDLWPVEGCKVQHSRDSWLFKRAVLHVVMKCSTRAF